MAMLQSPSDLLEMASENYEMVDYRRLILVTAFSTMTLLAAIGLVYLREAKSENPVLIDPVVPRVSTPMVMFDRRSNRLDDGNVAKAKSQIGE
jgi:hypothetical protein